MRTRFWLGMSMLIAGPIFFVVGVKASSPKSTTHTEFTDQACLDCHTDEARLRELAVEEDKDEIEEAPSEGPG